jgi:hypothetical protein
MDAIIGKRGGQKSSKRSRMAAAVFMMCVDAAVTPLPRYSLATASAQLQPQTEDVRSQSVHWWWASVCIALPQSAHHFPGAQPDFLHQAVQLIIKAHFLLWVHALLSI